MLELAAGDYALTLAPERGGTVLRFDWRGRSLLRHGSAPSNRGLPSQDAAWHGNWSVAAGTPRSTMLLLHHVGEDWTYVASQSFLLDETGLTMTLSLVNLGRGPMPADIRFGLGFQDAEVVGRTEGSGPVTLEPGGVRSASLKLCATAPRSTPYFC